MSGARANSLIALGLVALLGAVSWSAPRWSRVFREPIAPAPGDVASGPADRAAEPEPPGEAASTISVKLFFESPELPGLVIEEREVPFARDLGTQIGVTVKELLRGPAPESGLLPTLSPQGELLDVFVSPQGIAYVDLSSASAPSERGSEAELRSVYSVVDTITVNFPVVTRVQLLLDDQPATTLSGHVDLSRPLPPDMTLLAASTLTPQGSGPEGGEDAR